jgi:hypothetical protein
MAGRVASQPKRQRQVRFHLSRRYRSIVDIGSGCRVAAGPAAGHTWLTLDIEPYAGRILEVR